MKDNEIKYPIKYAVMEIPDSAYGFVVTKCYVLEDTIKYFSNGGKQEYYKVVFPYPNISNYKKKREYDSETKSLGERNYPKYDMFNQVCNACVIKDVFDSYNEAYAIATIRNRDHINDLHARLFSSGSSETEKEKLSLKFDRDMAICESFERLILENTKDMIVEGEKENPVDLENYEGNRELIRIYVNSQYRNM